MFSISGTAPPPRPFSGSASGEATDPATNPVALLLVTATGVTAGAVNVSRNTEPAPVVSMIIAPLTSVLVSAVISRFEGGFRKRVAAEFTATRAYTPFQPAAAPTDGYAAWRRAVACALHWAADTG